jgi:plasmid stability protein
MALLTIRSLDEDVKERLRVRAAKNQRSMEAEAREILKEAVKPRPEDAEDFASWFRKRVRGLEGELPIPRRSKGRTPPDLR